MLTSNPSKWYASFKQICSICTRWKRIFKLSLNVVHVFIYFCSKRTISKIHSHLMTFSDCDCLDVFMLYLAFILNDNSSCLDPSLTWVYIFHFLISVNLHANISITNVNINKCIKHVESRNHNAFMILIWHANIKRCMLSNEV